MDGHRAAHSIIDDDRNYSNIDEDQPTDPGGGDQAARSQGYETIIDNALRQPERPYDYAGLDDGQAAAASTQQTTEEIEMTSIDHGHAVSLSL